MYSIDKLYADAIQQEHHRLKAHRQLAKAAEQEQSDRNPALSEKARHAFSILLGLLVSQLAIGYTRKSKKAQYPSH